MKMVSLPPLWFSLQPSPLSPFEHAAPSPTTSYRIIKRLPRRHRRLSSDSSMSESNTTETSSSSDQESRSPHMQPERALLQPIGPNDPNYTECIDGPLSPEWDSDSDHEAEGNKQTSQSSDCISRSPVAQTEHTALNWVDPNDPDYEECIDGPLSPERDEDYEEESKDVVVDLPTSRTFGQDEQSASASSKKPVTPVPNRQRQGLSQKAAQITPIRPSLNVIESKDGEYEDDKVKNYIIRQFTSMVHREYPIVDFVRNIWHYNTPIPAGNYSIPMKYMTGYCDAVPDDQKLVGERAACIWLKKILSHLHDKLPDNPSYHGQFVNVHDSVVKGQYAKFKPDGSYNEETDWKRQVWDAMSAFNEVKHAEKIKSFKRSKKKWVSIDISIINKMLQTVPVEAYDNPSGKTAPLKRKRSDAAGSGQPSGSSKRSRTKSNTDANGLRTSRTKASRKSGERNAPDDEPSNPDNLTKYEIQAIKYANELQAHGVRNYSTGILFDHQFMSLWCIDRSGVIKSQEVNFLTHPHYLLLVVAAMKAASLAELGICPFLDYSDPHARFGKYDHVYLQLPRAVDEHGTEITDKDQLRFPLDVQPPTRDIQTTYGAIGRGTTIIPLKGVCASKETLIAKISWPAERRIPEDDFVRAIRTKLEADSDGKKYVQNIPLVKYSLSLNIGDADLAFPRGSMEVFEEQSEPRIFRLLIFVCYEPLQNVRNPKEFMKIFRDVVSAHHYVHMVVKILHRDVSITNIMFLRIGDMVIGILSDWDLAVGTSQEEQDAELMQLRGIDPRPANVSRLVVSSEAAPATIQPQTEDKWASMRFKTGTTPFMALDLLEDIPPPRHLYRYDLESFFYVLVWFCAAIKPKKKAKEEILKWENSSDEAILCAKRSFFKHKQELHKIVDDVDDQYKFLITSWIIPLRSVIARVHNLCEAIKVEYDTMDTVSSNQEEDSDETKEQKEKLDKLASYETFIEKLGS
ncbi:hypothetical protein C8Q75DRAFT_896166 [Abortiporus biennis]|nr:hypothetical protein C8Q75DRAFT_896166 [Abortiporus biennis]